MTEAERQAREYSGYDPKDDLTGPLSMPKLDQYAGFKAGFEAGARAMGERALPPLDMTPLDGMHYDDTDSYRNGFQDAVSWQRQRIKAELAAMEGK